jgi:AraC family transcriptional regulator of adaptative response / DNA-3-methyladenine glycosylase II
MLAFLERRAVPGVEAVRAGAYLRSVRLGATSGWIEVAPAPRRAALRVNASESLAGVLPELRTRLARLFDIGCQPAVVAAALGPLGAAYPGLRLPGAVDGFEVAVRAILGQQVTVRAATTIAGRFVQAFGEPLSTSREGVDRLFPAPAAIAALAPGEIARHGIFAARARAIVALAGELHTGRLRLEPPARVEATLAALQALPGVGPWTAHYVAMRALAWPDAFPHPDVAVLKALGGSAARAARAAERWRPWRSYAVLHLWKSLEAR